MLTPRQAAQQFGKKGGKKAASRMTKEQRKERARIAAAARWNKPPAQEKTA